MQQYSCGANNCEGNVAGTQTFFTENNFPFHDVYNDLLSKNETRTSVNQPLQYERSETNNTSLTIPSVVNVHIKPHKNISSNRFQLKTKKKGYYCQDRPCFSLKDIWKMLHCNHPPCFKNIFAGKYQRSDLNLSSSSSNKQPPRLANIKKTNKLVQKSPYAGTSPKQNQRLVNDEPSAGPLQDQESQRVAIVTLPVLNPKSSMYNNIHSTLEKNKCFCPNGQPDVNCDRRCLNTPILPLNKQTTNLQHINTPQAQTNAMFHPANLLNTKTPMISTLNQKVQAQVVVPKKRVTNQTREKVPFVSKICSSWTYYPNFRCISEYPIYTPLRKHKSSPYDGPYENCRTLPYLPFFKCYSNGLNLNVSAQRHKINKGGNKGNKIRNARLQILNKKFKQPYNVNIDKKMTDAVAKAMIENANKVNEKRKKIEMNKLNIYLRRKGPLNKINLPIKSDLSGKARISPIVVIKRKIPGRVLPLPAKVNVVPGLVNKPNIPGRDLLVAHKATIVRSMGIKPQIPGKTMSQSYDSKIASNLRYIPQVPASNLFVPYKVETPTKTLVQANKMGNGLLVSHKADIAPGFPVKLEKPGKDGLLPQKANILTSGVPLKPDKHSRTLLVSPNAGIASGFTIKPQIHSKGMSVAHKSRVTPFPGKLSKSQQQLLALYTGKGKDQNVTFPIRYPQN